MSTQTGTPYRGEVIRFAARDGVSLGGRYFATEHFAAEQPEGAVLIAPGTGIPSRFYSPFADWLAQHRMSSLVFDYRGIGDSLEGPIGKCDARKQDWGERDLPAALDEIARRVPDVPLSLVGHSAGGQLIGLMDNCDRFARVVQVAGSSGYFGGLSPGFRALAFLLMRVYGPISIRLLGYGATKRIGWGENLPAGVLQQWTYWCSRPGYVQNDFGRTIHEHRYDEIRCPILNLTAVDDPIATNDNVDDLLRLFPSAHITKERVRPSDHGLDRLEHVGFFRPSSSALWTRVLRFITGGT